MRKLPWIVALAATLILSGCAWGQIGHDATRLGRDGADDAITPSNVGQLQLSWSLPSNQYAGAYIAHGLLYSIDVQSVPARLVVFSADGSQDCGGSPRTCQPLWSAPLAGVLNGVEASGAMVYGNPYKSTSLAIDGNDVFVASRLGSTVVLEAFDALGVRNCSGAPRVCSARWRTTTEGQQGTLAVSEDEVLLLVERVAGGNLEGQLAAFTQDGSGCGPDPLTCVPRWSTRTRKFGYLAADRDHVLVTNAATLVFDRTGPNACAGTLCQPSGVLAFTYAASISGPTVFGATGTFDLNRVPSCPSQVFDNAPTCSPDWTPLLRWSALYQAPMLTEDHVFIAETLNNNGDEAYVRVFNREQTAPCTGMTGRCEPIADLVTHSDPRGLAGNRQLVFVVAGPGHHPPLGSISAFGLGLQQGCAGTPTLCEPLWQVSLDAEISNYLAPPVVASNLVAVTGAQGGVRVFALPS